MTAWTNRTMITLERIKKGSKTVFIDGAYFEVISQQGRWTRLRCYEPNPEAGYGLGSLVELDSSTRVMYDRNREKK